MKTQAPPTMILAAVAFWLFGTCLLLWSGANASEMLNSPVKASDSLTLSSKDQQTAWNDLNQATTASPSPSTFQPATSSALPSTVEVHAVPGKAASDVPPLKPYDFAKVQNKLLIVNPHDMMIAAVISG